MIEDKLSIAKIIKIYISRNIFAKSDYKK